MENGGKLISSISLYACGSCENKLNMILRGGDERTLNFPALVVKLKHSQHGTILFDTGYSQRVFGNGLISVIYNFLNPTWVEPQDTIAYKMEQEGETVDRIILSHPHPDHIGCLRDFNRYKLYLSEGCYDKMHKSHLLELVFKNQLPTNCIYSIMQPYRGSHFLKSYFNEIYDILGDGSVYGVLLDGHSKGQIGIYVPEYKTLFAADASWGQYFADNVERMRIIPRFIQNNFNTYKETINRINSLRRKHPEIRVIYSHEAISEGLYESED